MLYAIIGEDQPESLQNRLKARPDHLKRLELLESEGRLILAGPFPSADSENSVDAGYTGSLIVAEFSDLVAAQNWANADPYFKTGVYASISVKPFKQIFPK